MDSFNYHHKYLVVVALFVIFYKEWRSGFLPHLWKDVKSRPLRSEFSKKFSLLCALVFAILLLLDLPLLHFVQAWKGPFFEAVFSFGALFGKYYLFWPFLFVFYLVFLVMPTTHFRIHVMHMIVATLLTTTLAQILKFLFSRARPYANLGPYSFFNFQGVLQDDRIYQSFPSGDVALIAGAVAYLFQAFRGSTYRWLLLVLPVLTALSRISLDRHWPSDTFVSVCLGFWAVGLIWKPRNASFQTRS